MLKGFKRAVRTAVLGICCFLLTTAAFGSPNQDALHDVPMRAWYRDSVEYVVRHGVMRGTDIGFCPNNTTTREQFAQIMYNLFAADGEKDNPQYGSGTFLDVEPRRWYFPAVQWASEHGYISGYGDGRFGVGKPVTREQVCTILYRISEGKPSAIQFAEKIADIEEVSPYASDAVRWAYRMSIMEGDEKQLFYPQNPARRSEIAKIMMIFCQNILNIEHPPYSIRLLDYSYKNDAGEDYIQQYYELVELTGETAACDQINESIKTYYKPQQLSEKELREYYIPTVEKYKIPMVNNCSSAVTYYDGYTISILHDIEWWMGGVHNAIPGGQTFDLKTGKLLTAADLVDISQNQLDALIREAVRKYFSTYSPWNTAWDERISEMNGRNLNFYVKNGKIVICIEPYIFGWNQPHIIFTDIQIRT